MESEINFGCSEELAELCALATSGCLTIEEEERLAAHVAKCADCALLLNQYRAVASDGMAQLASSRVKPEPQFRLENASALKARVLAELEPLVREAALVESREIAVVDRFRSLFRIPVPVLAAAMFLLAMGAGYVLGTTRQSRVSPSVVVSPTIQKSPDADIEAQLASAKSDVDVANAKADVLQSRSEKAEKALADLRDAKAQLEQRLQVLNTDSQRDAGTIAALTAARDALTKRLQDSEGLLLNVQQQIKSVQDERQGYVLRAANLEFQVNQLTAELKEASDASHRTEQYLASDRDVRELMGARQLYIADVFDIDPQGRTKKPFGRVFYTKGKSLIFYAFDLDQQPGYREAKAFQAWGRPSVTNGQPVSLGIFYMDNEKNRRWALKFTDPRVLDEINSLFVTLEPKGGSAKPTNKPFLVAYLHSAAPNHP